MTELPEQLHRCFQEAFNRHDLDAVVAVYEADAVLVSAQARTAVDDSVFSSDERVLDERRDAAFVVL